MVRAPYFDENGTKKGAWSEEEDQRLIAYIERYGHPNWRQLPKVAGLARCGKSCRLRWMNYLRPNLKRGSYTQKEEQMIMELHKKHGNKWSLIAEKLPGRSDNEIKNYWHSHLKKISWRNETNLIKETQKTKTSTSEDVSDDSHHILESSTSMSSEMSSNHVELNINLYKKEDSVASWEIWDGFSSNFWTEPFISENALGQDYSPVSWYGSEAEDPFFIW